jgi:glycosyltransferase involved in cell wall biosynthesis
MRVAVVSDAVFPYHTGGKETRYRHIVAQLCDQGHHVTVYTMHWWPGAKTKTTDGVEYRAIMGRAPLYKGSRRSISEAVRFALACFQLVRYRYDVIEADHMPYLQLVPLRLVAAVRRVPLVVTWHELWGPEYWRKYLGRLGVIAAAPPSAGYDLLFAGRLIAHKGVAMALEAVQLLQQRGISCTFGIVGVGPEADRLKQQSEALGLGGQVAFLGYLEDEVALFSLMKGSRLFLLPSIREGFGLAVVEALAAGAPTITVNHADNYAQRLVVEGETGWVCDPTATSLADAIAKGLSTPMDVRAYAAPLLAQYRWEEAGAQTAKAYLRAIGAEHVQGP